LVIPPTSRTFAHGLRTYRLRYCASSSCSLILPSRRDPAVCCASERHADRRGEPSNRQAAASWSSAMPASRSTQCRSRPRECRSERAARAGRFEARSCHRRRHGRRDRRVRRHSRHRRQRVEQGSTRARRVSAFEQPEEDAAIARLALVRRHVPLVESRRRRTGIRRGEVPHR
jgi:hypothetical protein